MMNILTICVPISMLIGFIAGAVVMRYGIGLGNKLTINSKDDIPLDDNSTGTTQEFTE